MFEELDVTQLVVAGGGLLVCVLAVLVLDHTAAHHLRALHSISKWQFSEVLVVDEEQPELPQMGV